MKPNILRVMKTILCTYGITVAMLLFLTLILYKFQVGSNKMMIGVVATYFLSNLIGGFIFGKVTGRKKYLYGAMVGAIYFLILLIISAVFSKEFALISKNTLTAMISCVLGGMVGGMIS